MGLLLRLGRGLGFRIAAPQAVPIHVVVGGAVGPPPFYREVQNVRLRGRVIRVAAQLVPGQAYGTAAAAELLQIGKAAGDANCSATNWISSKTHLIIGKASGEKYLTEEEIILILADAA